MFAKLLLADPKLICSSALEEYQELFRSHRRLQGGFIWEWANHGLWKPKSSTSEGYYGYGGDFGDTPNDGTFAMDGLCFSDHTATPGLTELKKVFEPLKVVMEGSAVRVFNGHDFRGLDFLDAVWNISSYSET